MLQKPAPEIGAINSTPDSGASFSCRCTTSNVRDCLRGLASNLGLWHRFLEPVSGVGVRGLGLSLGIYDSHWTIAKMTGNGCQRLQWRQQVREVFKSPIYEHRMCWIGSQRCHVACCREQFTLPRAGLCKSAVRHRLTSRNSVAVV